MDPDVVEIPPPLHQNPPKRVKKEKQSVYHDVIELESDEDLVVLGEASRKRSKGKAVETVHGGDGDHKPDIGKSGTVSGIKSSNGKPSLPSNVIIIDGQDSKPLTLKPEYNPLKPNNSKTQGKSPHFGQFESAKQGVASSNSFPSNLFGHNGPLQFGNRWLNFGSTPQHSRGKPNVLNSARVGQNGAYVIPPSLTTISYQNNYFETDYEDDYYENDYEDEDNYYANDYEDDYYETYSAPPAYYPTTRVPIKSEPSIKSEPFIKYEPSIKSEPFIKSER